MPTVSRRRPVSRHHPVPRPVELIPSPEPVPTPLYSEPFRCRPALKPVKPFIFRKPPAMTGGKSTGHQGADIDNPLYDESKSRPVSKPVKPVVHPSGVSRMEEVSRQIKASAKERMEELSRQIKASAKERNLARQEAQWAREKARTENVYSELHLMDLINEHTGNK